MGSDPASGRRERKENRLLMIELLTHASMRDVGEAIWKGASAPDVPPFLSWDFLDAMEQTGCVQPSVGWMPLHLSLRQNDEVVAVAPAYVKGNSEGEFVFDHGWARFAEERIGVQYYPKLIVAAAFTPATGARVLTKPGVDRASVLRVFAAALAQLCERLPVSSAHVLFSDEREAVALADAGMAHRYGLQYHWRNSGYTSFDEFLSRFSSKRRNQIRRERRDPERQGIALEVFTGRTASPTIIDHAYRCYLSTVDKHFWGRQYLNREFFDEVCSRLGDRIMIVVAREGRRPLAAAFNLVGTTALYGRYWGAVEDRQFLHFNVCYYAGIEYCIEHKLSVFEPGAGGEHKLSRGFEPTVTHSTHLVQDNRLDMVVRDFVARERHAIIEHQREYAREPILKAGA